MAFSQNHLDNLKPHNVELEGIETSDYPDFCNAFVKYAEHINGEVFTDQELDYFNENYADEVYELVIKQIL